MKTRQFLFVLIFVYCPITTIAQVNLDSLLVVWNNRALPDTSRLKTIEIIARDGYRLNNPDSAFYYAQLQYDLAELTGHRKWMAASLITQGEVYSMKGKHDTALDYYLRGVKISEEIGDKRHMASGLNNIGTIYRKKGDIDSCLEYLSKSLKLYKELGAQKKTGISLINIGIVYRMKGNLDEAIEYLNRGIKISKEIENLEGVASGQNVLATINLEQGNYKEALELYTINILNYEKLGNNIGIAGTRSNIGSVYLREGEYHKALENLTVALKGFEELGVKHGVAGISKEIGYVYFKLKNYKPAIDYTSQGLKLYEEIGYQEGIADAESSMAIIYTDRGRHDEAISLGNDALRLSRESGNILAIKDIAKNLVVSYKASGSYKKAFEMNELYFKMRDSLNSVENQKAIIEIQVQSDYDKQKAIDDLKNEKEIAIQEQKTTASQRISWAIGIGLLLISILAYAIFNKLKVTRKQKVIIEEQKKKVEQSEKYKEQFLANMSHEIRTPMHAISGMIKILDRNEHPSTQDVYLNAMQTSSDNLVVILNDVLDLSKIEAGKLEIESIPMNPRLVVENVNQILKYKADEKGLKLSYTIDDSIPSLVVGDPTRLNQVLVNLVGNAIKFTGKGSVDISLEVKNERLQFQVNDTGVGIAQSQQEHVFGAFEQAKDSTARHYGGTGLGLSISKQLVELQEGKIWLESTEGVGSSFYVELPLTTAQADAVGVGLISEEKLKAMAASLKGIRILIAEDNPFNQMIAQDDLSYYINDITIKTVENGVLALEEFNKASYDLILMDVQMPEMNGFEATKKIREFEKQENRTTAIPIIAMTASLLKTEIDSCYDAGMDNYIPKPYTLEELIGPIFKELRA